MRKVIYKYFWVWQFEKEEKWLNEMAAKGLALTGMHFNKYTFEETLPGEYQIRLELLQNRWNHPESERYIRFLEETGAEHVASWISWVYFRRKSAEGPFDLYSDTPSRIRHLNRVLALLWALTAATIPTGIYNIVLFFLWRNPISLLGLVSLTMGGLLLWGITKLTRQKKRLLQEQQIFE